MQVEKLFLIVVLCFLMNMVVLEAAPILVREQPPHAQWINYFPLILVWWIWLADDGPGSFLVEFLCFCSWISRKDLALISTHQTHQTRMTTNMAISMYAKIIFK